MSSHWDYAERVCKRHDIEKPFAPENGQPLRFSVGDKVVFTNDEGVEFDLCVSGLYKPEGRCSLYATGRRYLLDWSCHWFPVREGSLRPRE